MRLPDRNRISPGKKGPLQRVPGIFRHKLQGKRVRRSAVEFAGEGRDHFALLGLVGSQCLVGQGGALAVLGQQGAHLVYDVVHLFVTGSLHGFQLTGLAHHDGDFAALGLLGGRQSLVLCRGRLDGVVQAALGPGLDGVELVDESLQLLLILRQGSGAPCAGVSSLGALLGQLLQRGAAGDEFLQLDRKSVV